MKHIVLERMKANPRGWVTDHHSCYVRHLILKRAESAVLLGLPFGSVLWRRFKRSGRRARTKEIVCGGGVETFWQQFVTRESAIFEIWERRKRHLVVGETVSAAVPPGLDFYYIRTTCPLDEFCDVQELSKDARTHPDGRESARGA